MEHLAPITQWRNLRVINNLDDLVRYTEQRAKVRPLIARRVRITRPGFQPHIIAALRQEFPGLPDGYVSVAESVAIDGISIGYFNLTPSLSRAPLPDELRAYNDPVITPMAERYRLHGVYQVASWEADPICVVHTNGMFRVGQVVMYTDANLGPRPTRPPAVLADSFEQFLLIAANLDEIRGRYAGAGEPTRALHEFREYLTPLVVGRQDDMESAWMQIASVVLA
jgi:hypothetical protein